MIESAVDHARKRKPRRSAQDQALFFLPKAAPADLPVWRFSPLRPASKIADESASFTLLDCFDQSVRRSNRVLLKVGDEFQLLQGDGAPALSQRVKGDVRFVTDFPKGALRRALGTVSPLRSLLPLGSGELIHASLALVDDEDKTHCRAHLVFLRSEAGRTGCLIALQQIKGYDASFAVLRNQLEKLGALPLGSGGLYRHLFPGVASYEAKPEIAIARDETAFHAANAIIDSCIPVARANEGGVIADHDTEFLHDYRIQLRKVRSVLSLFKGVYDDAQTADLKTRFSALMAPTGRLRDLDVYLLERQQYFDLVPQSLHGGLKRLFDMFAKQRADEHARLSRHLRSRAYTREIKDLARLFARAESLTPGVNADLPAHDYASGLIWKRYRKVCAIAAAIGPGTEDAEIHELRIHCKKLRYLMEFFGSVFPRPAFTSLLKPLKRLQDNLGLFNDYSVQQVSLQAFLDEIAADRDNSHVEIAQSVGALIAVLHGRQLEERAKVMKSFAYFNSSQTQQTFAELFKKRKEA